MPKLIEVYRSILASLDDCPSSFCGYTHKTRGLQAVLSDVLGDGEAISSVVYEQRSQRCYFKRACEINGQIKGAESLRHLPGVISQKTSKGSESVGWMVYSPLVVSPLRNNSWQSEAIAERHQNTTTFFTCLQLTFTQACIQTGILKLALNGNCSHV